MPVCMSCYLLMLKCYAVCSVFNTGYEWGAVVTQWEVLCIEACMIPRSVQKADRQIGSAWQRDVSFLSLVTYCVQHKEATLTFSYVFVLLDHGFLNTVSFSCFPFPSFFVCPPPPIYLLLPLWLFYCNLSPLFTVIFTLFIHTLIVPLIDPSWASIDQPLTGTVASSLLKEWLWCLSSIDSLFLWHGEGESAVVTMIIWLKRRENNRLL